MASRETIHYSFKLRLLSQRRDLIDHLNDTAPEAEPGANSINCGELCQREFSQNCRRWRAQQRAGESSARRVTSSTRAAGRPNCCPTSCHPAQSLSGRLNSCCPGCHGPVSSERRSATSSCDSMPRSEFGMINRRDCVYHATRCSMLHVTFATRHVEQGPHDQFRKRFAECVSSGHHVCDEDMCPAATGRTATNLSRSYTADSSEPPDPPETDISAGLQLRL